MFEFRGSLVHTTDTAEGRVSGVCMPSEVNWAT